MKESLARELLRMQDVLVEFIPLWLWHQWAEVNEEVVDVLLQDEEANNGQACK